MPDTLPAGYLSLGLLEKQIGRLIVIGFHPGHTRCHVDNDVLTDVVDYKALQCMRFERVSLATSTIQGDRVRVGIWRYISAKYSGRPVRGRGRRIIGIRKTE